MNYVETKNRHARRKNDNSKGVYLSIEQTLRRDSRLRTGIFLSETLPCADQFWALNRGREHSPLTFADYTHYPNACYAKNPI